jgi:hypothetical protein
MTDRISENLKQLYIKLLKVIFSDQKSFLGFSLNELDSYLNRFVEVEMIDATQSFLPDLFKMLSEEAREVLPTDHLDL